MHEFLRCLMPMFLASTLGSGLPSQSSRRNCTSLQPKVPKAQLKYMLGGDLVVVWDEGKSTSGVFSAHICCEKPLGLVAKCSNVCPNYKVTQSCVTTSTSTYSSRRECSISVYQYVEYSVRLSGELHGCQLKGDVIKITPQLIIAYPDPVAIFDVISQPEGLLLRWKKPFQYVQQLYSVSCHQVVSANGEQEIDESLNVMNSYQCCLRVRLPYNLSSHYSEVCNRSRSQVRPAKFLCGIKHECKNTDVDSLRNFAVQFQSSTSDWFEVPPAIVLEVRTKERNRKRKSVLNEVKDVRDVMTGGGYSSFGAKVANLLLCLLCVAVWH